MKAFDFDSALTMHRSGKIVHLADKAIVEFGALSERIEALLLQIKTEIRKTG